MGIKKVDDAWKNNSNRIEKISKERSKRYKGSISKNDWQILSHVGIKITRANVTVLRLTSRNKWIIFWLHKHVHIKR